MSKFSEMTNEEMHEWIVNFVEVVGDSPTDYGLTAGQVTDLQTNNNILATKMTDRVAKDEAAAAAVIAERDARKVVEPVCSYYNTTIKGNPDVSDEAKVAAGIDLKKPPTFTSPVAPTDLVVNGFENGTNVLKWKRAANKPNTQFIIEYREASETEFEYLATSTQTTYKHTGVTPGMQCAYRIKAQRAGEESPFSNVAVVYMS